MATHQESYKLRWGDFQGNLVESLQELRESEDFLDVTVACDEETQLRAHKVILSASSPYFRSLLKRNPSKHPMLVMPPNVRFQDLAAILEFMYNGEVSVNNDELESFMSTAELLKVKGLTQDKAAKNNKPPPPKIPKFPSGIQINRQRSLSSSGAQANKRARIMPPMDQFPAEEEEEEDSEIREVAAEESGEYFEDFDSNSAREFYSEDGSQQQPAAANPGGGTQLMGLICPDCRMMCHGVQALKDHMAHSCRARPRPFNRQAAEQVSCNICDKNFKNQKSMVAHQKRVHKLGGPMEDGPLGPQGLMGVPGMVKRRGRPCKKPRSDDNAGEEGEYFDTLPQTPAPKSHETGRPVGQVPPAPRPSGSGTPQPAGPQEPKAPQTEESNSRPSSRDSDVQTQQQMIQQPQQQQQQPIPQNLGRSMGPRGGLQRLPMGSPRHKAPNPLQQPSPRMRHLQGLPNRNMDLQKLGMKFGGQISITSSETSGGGGQSTSNNANQGGVKRINPNAVRVEGVSITKLKGEVPAGSSPVPAKERRPPQSEQVEVKEEPAEQYDEDEEDQGQYDEGQYPEDEYEPSVVGGYGDMEGGSVDGMYEGYDNNVEEEEDEYVPPAHNRRFAPQQQQQQTPAYDDEYQAEEGHKM